MEWKLLEAHGSAGAMWFIEKRQGAREFSQAALRQLNAVHRASTVVCWAAVSEQVSLQLYYDGGCSGETFTTARLKHQSKV